MQLELDFQEISELHQLVERLIQADLQDDLTDLTVFYRLRTKLSNALAVHAMQQLSPVPTVPNNEAGETTNDTPKQNPLSNGVPVSNDYDDVYTCSECGCFTDYLVGAGSRCRQCVDEMGG